MQEVSTPSRSPSSRMREPSSKALENIANDATLFAINTTIYPLADPKNDAEMLASPQRKEWIEADLAELQALRLKDTWRLVPPPTDGSKVTGSRFVRKVKWQQNSHYDEAVMPKTEAYAVKQFKSRLVYQGYGMEKGVDFAESYAAVVTSDAERILTCIAIWFGLWILSVDFDNFFLNGKMKEEKPVYMKQPPRYEDKDHPDWVCELVGSLYGHPTAPLRAQEKQVEAMAEAGFHRLPSEPMMFNRHEKGEANCCVTFHVDDGKGVTSDRTIFDNMVKSLRKSGLGCKVDEKPVKFLGLNYDYTTYKGSVLVHQRHNVEQFILSLGLQDAKPQFTPMDPRIDLNGDDDQPPGVPCNYKEKKLYQSLAGQAIWLLRTRYDACYAINARCRKMAAPDKEDLVLMKRLGRFFKGTPKLGLIFNPSPKNGKIPKTFVYVDCGLRIKTVSGLAGFIGEPDYVRHINLNAAVAAFTQTERAKVTSTMMGEVVSIERGVVFCEYTANLRQEMGYPQDGPGIIFTDSQPAIRFLTGTGALPNRQTRHHRRQVEYIKDRIARNIVVLKYVPSALNCADVLTKALPRVLFMRHVNNLIGRWPGQGPQLH